MTTLASIETPIGRVSFSVVADTPASVSVREYTPELPQGMETSFCCAALFVVESRELLTDLRFEVTLPDSCNLIGPESGQFLEAYSWRCRDNVVYIGTEDSEALVNRLGASIGLNEYSVITSAENSGMLLTIPKYDVGEIVSFHFVLATNPYPEPCPDSCWFAVEVPHKNLMARE